jgi:predicted RecB family nuclease
MVLLNAYAAKTCVRRVHNESDPTILRVDWVPPAEVQLRIDAGRAFEDEALEQLRAALRPEQYVDLRGLGRTETLAGTLAALADGVEVVIGGWLPDDEAGGRKGRPDLLVRAGDGTGYVPGEVKGHRITKAAKKGGLDFSRLATPAVVEHVEGLVPCKTDRLDDYLQLAHYWRMLEACGHAAGAARGVVIGTDDLSALDGSGLALVWLDLEAASFATYSRSQGKAKRTALERYDHEHAFRLQVAEVAGRRTGAASDPAPLVEPIFTEECKSCPWFEYCLDVAGPDAVSAQVMAGAFSRREWLTLERLGCTSLDRLADLDTADAAFLDAYLPEVTHLPGAVSRLEDMVRRARMVRAGVVVERTTSGPIDVPRADVEVDLDIEWGLDNRVYLWGALVRRAGVEPTYRPAVAWDLLDEAGEHELASSFVAWLRELIAAGVSVRVYHYSHAEPTHLKRVLGADAFADLAPYFVDLHAIVKQHFFGARGLGIKSIAPAFGFAWRDETPSGVQSQLWVDEARSASDPAVAQAARTRLLEYNEDDVRATAALREWLAGAGSVSPAASA